jgi:hypothetical protein
MYDNGGGWCDDIPAGLNYTACTFVPLRNSSMLRTRDGSASLPAPTPPDSVMTYGLDKFALSSLVLGVCDVPRQRVECKFFSNAGITSEANMLSYKWVECHSVTNANLPSGKRFPTRSVYNNAVSCPFPDSARQRSSLVSHRCVLPSELECIL